MNKKQLKELLYKKFVQTIDAALSLGLNENIRANFVPGLKILPDNVSLKDLREIINEKE